MGCTTGAGGAAGGGITPVLASMINWRDPPRALPTACSSKLARLCTMPIQLPATCTTARFASSRTNCACWDSSMRVEGNSRLPKICCHSSGRLVPLVAGVGVATSTVGSSGVFACAGEGDGAAGVVAAGVVGVGVGVGTGAVTGTGEGAVAIAGDIGSAKSPSNSTSSHRRGCTL